VQNFPYNEEESEAERKEVGEKKRVTKKELRHSQRKTQEGEEQAQKHGL